MRALQNPFERRMGMPLYEFRCEKCDKEVSLTLTIGEREGGKVTCPHCGSTDLQPLLATFFSKTSRKS
jgi:putative FmdB family regulatory protein